MFSAYPLTYEKTYKVYLLIHHRILCHLLLPTWMRIEDHHFGNRRESKIHQGQYSDSENQDLDFQVTLSMAFFALTYPYSLPHKQIELSTKCQVFRWAKRFFQEKMWIFFNIFFLKIFRNELLKYIDVWRFTQSLIW